MGFKIGASSSMANAQTQSDIVAAMAEPIGETVTENVKMPGVDAILNMTEHQLIDFFETLLKTRRTVREVRLTLGEDYVQREVNCSVPKSNLLHSQSFKDNAKTFVAALASNPKAVGFRAVISVDAANNSTSRITLFVADKAPNGPTLDNDGNMLPGDLEYAPQLFLTHRT